MSRPPRLQRVMDGPVCLPRLGVHTHTHNTHHRTHTHFSKDTQKQLTLLFSSFVIATIPPQANLALVLSCGLPAVRVELRNPTAIKYLLLLPNSLLRTHHSGTIYFIYYYFYTHTSMPASAHTVHSSGNRPQKIYHPICLSAPAATYQGWKLLCFVGDSVYTIRPNKPIIMAG